jgi:putative transposase
MAAPHRGNTGYGTYFITASSFQKQSIFQTYRMANLFVEVLLGYRAQEKYLLHEFVLMPNHFHLLITPTLTLERALQLIKGGFSFRAKKDLGFTCEVWEKSFYDRRVRDWEEYCAFRRCIHQNPVRKGLATTPEEHRYIRDTRTDAGCRPSAAEAVEFDCLNRSGEPLRHPRAPNVAS